jgi:uncharacterized protein (DUF4213/DUF364 family)
MIFEQTCNLLLSRYRSRIGELYISDVRIGSHLTAVRLSDSSVGTAATLDETHPFCAKHDRDFGDFSPLKIIGQKVPDILGTKKESGIISSLKTAVINAVSSGIISSGNYRIIEDCDPIGLLDLTSRRTITIVGAFQSYIRKISETENKLYVLELSENAFPPEQKKFYVPADEYINILPVSDIIIITGQTLVNRTLDDLLSVVSPGTKVIVTGPSSGIIPDILFENKVSIIGSVRITNPEVLFDIVSQGGSGFHLFEYCARKICILKDDESPVK